MKATRHYCLRWFFNGARAFVFYVYTFIYIYIIENCPQGDIIFCYLRIESMIFLSGRG